MFGLFKKKQNSNHVSDVALLRNIFQTLGKDFSSFDQQLSEGLIVKSRKTDTPVPGYVSFAYDNTVLNKFENKSGRSIALRGIRVFDLVLNDYVELQINICYGLIFGYFPKGKTLTTPVVDRVQVDGYTVNYTGEDSFDPIKELISEADARLINPMDVYEVKLKGKVFYHLADIEGEDGDFIGVDKSKKLYKISHDPFEIIEISEPLSHWLGK